MGGSGRLCPVAIRESPPQPRSTGCDQSRGAKHGACRKFPSPRRFVLFSLVAVNRHPSKQRLQHLVAFPFAILHPQPNPALLPHAISPGNNLRARLNKERMSLYGAENEADADVLTAT